MGYTLDYPVDLPQGGGGVSAVKIDSKGNLWAFQRNAAGKPQLFEFGRDRKLIRTVGDDVMSHQEKHTGWLSTRKTTCGSAMQTGRPL